MAGVSAAKIARPAAKYVLSSGLPGADSIFGTNLWGATKSVAVGMATAVYDTHEPSSHSIIVGYLYWLLGMFGAHRFYYGKPVTGAIWFFTLGLLFIGWIIDLFLIPEMDREANARYAPGPIDYTLAWVLLTFLGLFGVHRFLMGKWISGIIWLLTGGLLGIGWIYDLLTLNEQVDEINRQYVRA